MTIFVFGSNLAGIHGAGSALAAVEIHGAIYGLGVGPQGDSYAIPTKDCSLRIMPLEIISKYVAQFIEYAKAMPHLDFKVVAIGCGLAGFKPKDIAPMFKGAPSNCWLPQEFIVVNSK